MEILKSGSGSKSGVLTVTELTERIKTILEQEFDFVWVEGEISNFRSPMSGHYYMTLKDERSQIRAVMFKMQARLLKFRPEDGMKVIGQGRVSVYAPRGDYQLILDYLEPLGVGALALAFEQLKKKLADMGVFDEKLKKPLPLLPQRIAVITSPTGAAIRDFLKVIRRRFINLEIVIIPVKVQGEEATVEIIEAIEAANRELDVDVIVITRGGGSLEDLWAFNKEELAYAIRRSSIPVVSAVGHEIDTTICDLAADLRAPTPSAAAEILVGEKETLKRTIEELKKRLAFLMREQINLEQSRLKGLLRHLKDPRRGLAELWFRLDEINGRLSRAIGWTLETWLKRLKFAKMGLIHHCPEAKLSAYKQTIFYCVNSMTTLVYSNINEQKMKMNGLGKRLENLNPMSVLKRGYSITKLLPSGKIVTKSTQTSSGDKIEIILSEGRLYSRVEKTS